MRRLDWGGFDLSDCVAAGPGCPGRVRSHPSHRARRRRHPGFAVGTRSQKKGGHSARRFRNCSLVQACGVFQEYSEAGKGLYSPGSQKQDLEHPPTHRDTTAMNGAQLFKIQRDSSELMNGPPAYGTKGTIRPTRENHAQDCVRCHSNLGRTDLQSRDAKLRTTLLREPLWPTDLQRTRVRRPAGMYHAFEGSKQELRRI